MDTTNTVPQAIVDFLKLREGVKNVVYNDTLGKPTAGMGHLLTDTERPKYRVGATVPEAVTDAWAKADSLKAYRAALSQAARLKVGDANFIKVLTSVNFQNGTAWNLTYKKTWAFMVAGMWELAATEAQKSTWFKQTPVRVQDFQAALRGLIAQT